MNYSYPLEQSFVLGPMRFRVETDGEKILKGFPETGFLHRGIEKICEKQKWVGVIPYSERVDYLSPMHSSLAYVLAVEKLAEISVSDRAKVIRVVVSELNRISSHLLFLGHCSRAIGLNTAFIYCLRDREKINNLFEMLCGARVLYSYMRIGGVAADITEGFVEKCFEFLDYLRNKMREYTDLLFNNMIFKGRTIGVGVLKAPVLIASSVSGPALRASGVKTDVRKSNPYCGYEKYEFQIPVGSSSIGVLGDSFERIRIRLLEIEQSLQILKQALNKIPEGQFAVPIPKIFKIPRGESLVFVESSRGSFGVYIRSLGEKTPDRVKFKAPSLGLINLFPDVLNGSSVSDLPVILNSLDFSISEIDR